MEIKRDKLGRFLKGEKSTSWKGGIVGDGQGYIKIWKPDHPNNNHGYILQHRYVMEQELGRYLKINEVVHHINGNKQDNQITNLIVMTRHQHPANHQIGRPIPKETREKIRKSLMGHPVSKKTLKKISIGVNKAYKEGKKFGFQKGNIYGKNYS
ncbi:MAG: HNH endonuclease [Patescibacteria group bacterium]|nr:HNH endonuclease [Patescibacteria group bacterium]MDE2015894.1 HNH endonuclease [Patescibacteria group bacterium]